MISPVQSTVPFSMLETFHLIVNNAQEICHTASSVSLHQHCQQGMQTHLFIVYADSSSCILHTPHAQLITASRYSVYLYSSQSVYQIGLTCTHHLRRGVSWLLRFVLTFDI